jgi:hypothetical protein
MFELNAAERIRYMLGCMNVMPAYAAYKNFSATEETPKVRKVGYGTIIRAAFAKKRLENSKKGQ